MATAPREQTHSTKTTSYSVKPSFADDGAPRDAIFRGDAFVEHVAHGTGEAAIKAHEDADKAEAEEQKTRDKRRDANKAAGIHAAEKRGETVSPEMHRFAEAHDKG